MVLGARFFRGEVEGKLIDSARILTLAPMSPGAGYGYGPREWICADSSVVAALETVAFPARARLHTRDEVRGSKPRVVVTAIEAVKAAK